jgi:hypothetical protein
MSVNHALQLSLAAFTVHWESLAGRASAFAPARPLSTAVG